VSRVRTVRLRLGRSWEDGPGPTAFAVSAVLHAAGVAALLVAAASQGPRPSPWTSTRVRLVSGEAARSPLRPVPAFTPPEASPPAEPEPVPEPSAEPRARPPAPERRLAIGPRREPPEQRRPEPEPLSRRDEPPPAEPRPERVVRAGGAEARFEGSDVPHDAYLGGVVRRVAGSWLKPRTGLPARPTRVYFVIGRDGAVGGIRLEQSSGVDAYDRAALRAVRLAAPLPLLPPAYPHESLKVHFDFIP
jgi:TonB family protein